MKFKYYSNNLLYKPINILRQESCFKTSHPGLSE